MCSPSIPHLIINSPFTEPAQHWHYDRATSSFHMEHGRRPAGYVKATEGSKAFDDPGVFVELPLANQIRPRVKAWREAGYPGVTGITRRLLEHWRDREARPFPFFFCQLEAIETLIWLAESRPAERQGITIPRDGGPFARLCCKMATGSGKTIVMAMLIVWQVLNKVAYPQDRRFSRHVFVVAPGLTVRKRLQVLLPEAERNYYKEFEVVPGGLTDKLRLGKVQVRNWHALNWETDEQLARKKGVDKRGAKSDEAYVRAVLGELAGARNMLVINDEAHHAWRVKGGARGLSRELVEEATKWIGGLDRIHRTRGVLTCYDFTATPFVPSGRKSAEEDLFGWIVSDFGLNDSIESGLVKTPRVVVRDDALPDARTFKSRLYHIYMDPEVKTDLNRKAQEHEPLPQLVQNGYYLLGKDWLETLKKWQAQNHKVPPVMITVANRVETAARVKYAFDHAKIMIEELCRPDSTLHIDTKVLEEAESQEEPVFMGAGQLTGETAGEPEEDEENAVSTRRLTRKQQAELLRQQVDTVGKPGEAGEQIQNVISVGMLSEGWDAKTVTHIMGLRAFSSQLLCEQVVGRGLRRTSYEMQGKETDPAKMRFDAEYVNIFGIPFTFLPHEGSEGGPPPPPTPKTEIKPLPEKIEYQITWPNVIRVDHEMRPRLALELGQVGRLELDASKTALTAEMAAIIEGKPHLDQLTEIELTRLGQRFRTQKIVFETAVQVFDQMKPAWKASRELLLAQLIGLVEGFVTSGRIAILPRAFERDDLRRRILVTLNINKVVHHVWGAIRFQNTEALVPVFDAERPIRGTADMRPWFTGRPNELTQRSHINRCVYDSAWEAGEAYILDHDPHVAAWAKNDHLGFEVLYTFEGVVHKFWPDFLVRLANGKMLVLEVKGEETLTHLLQSPPGKQGF